MWRSDLARVCSKLKDINIINKKSHYEKDIISLLPIDKYTFVNDTFYDVLYDGCVKMEFKKQTGGQWFDLKKLSKLPQDHLSTHIVFFCFGKSTDIRVCNYSDILAYFDSHLSSTWREWAVQAPQRCQIKYQISQRDIKAVAPSIVDVRA